MNIELGIISIAFPEPKRIAADYFAFVLAGDEGSALALAGSSTFCRTATQTMIQEHIATFAGVTVRNVNVDAGYWENAPTDYSPARNQIGVLEFEYTRDYRLWQADYIRINIWQDGWRRIVCGWPV